MHHEREVGVNGDNPHLCTTYIMLNSIVLTMSFKNALDAYHCLKQVSALRFPTLVKAFYSEGSFPHVVVIELSRKSTCILDQIDVHILANYANHADYYWSVSLQSSKEVLRYRYNYTL